MDYMLSILKIIKINQVRVKNYLFSRKEMNNMKKFIFDLFATITISLVAFPCCIIGLGIAGWVYGEKVEPWLEKNFGRKID